MKRTTAFSLLEVLLAAVIFTIAVAGVFTTLNAVRQPVLQKERALRAALVGQQELETLRGQVSASSINVLNSDGYAYRGDLAFGPHNPPTPTTYPPGYSINYRVSCVTSGNVPGLCAQDTPLMINETVTFPDT